MPDHPSALETYLSARGQDVEARNAFAQQLFTDALTISQECAALDALDARFPHPGQMPVVASATLAALRYSHHERLSAALGQERLLLALFRDRTAEASATPDGGATASPGGGSLQQLAAGNLAAARDLTQTNAPASVHAEQLFEEMAAGLNKLAIASQWLARPSNEDTAHQSKSIAPLQSLQSLPSSNSKPSSSDPLRPNPLSPDPLSPEPPR